MSTNRRPHRLLLVITVAIAALVAYAILVPLAMFFIHGGRQAGAALDGSVVWLAEQFRVRTFEFLIGLWVFTLGASLGSFLNVVIYRMPRGMSLLGSSRCPRCCCRIPARDNLPVIGWLLLAGRCRTCRLPISPRYPLVEFAVGAVFLVLAWLELLRGGANLPGARTEPLSAVSWLVGHVRWELAANWGYHCLLIGCLLAWALIRADGFAIPRLLIGIVLGCGVVVPAVYPGVHPVAWTGACVSGVSGAAFPGGLVTALVGGIAGAGLGVFVDGLAGLVRRAAGPPPRSPVSPRPVASLGETRLREIAAELQQTSEQPCSPAPAGNAAADFDTEKTALRGVAEVARLQAAVACGPNSGESGYQNPLRRYPAAGDEPDGCLSALTATGLYLGWQAALAVALTASAVRLALSPAAGAPWQRVAAAAAVCAAAFFQLCCWRITATLAWWPGPDSGPVRVLVSVALLACLTGLSWRVVPPSGGSGKTG